MGIFDWDEDLIPLIQSPGGNAPTQAKLQIFRTPIL